MNTMQLLKIMHNMYADAIGMKRKPQPQADNAIQSFLIRLYNTTELDWEEIKSLWWEYLTKGKLSIPSAMQSARKRGAL